MADCEALIDATFLNTITGADINSDTERVDSLILIVSTLIGEEYGACVAPDQASMRLRVVCAQYVSYVLGSGTGSSIAASVRAEQIGDYRVEFRNRGEDQFDLQLLRAMLNTLNSAQVYGANTMPDKTSSRGWPRRPALWEAVTTE